MDCAGVCYPNWVFFSYVIVQTLRQQCERRPNLTLNESLHDCPCHDHDNQEVRQSLMFSHNLGRFLP